MEINLTMDFTRYTPTKTFQYQNKLCYLDVATKKFVLATEKEKSRQTFINYLIDAYKAPRHQIALDQKLKEFDANLKDSCDIMVYEADETYKYPMMIVKCLNYNQEIQETDFDDLLLVDEIIKATLIVVTNGTQASALWYDLNSNEYVYLDELTTYTDDIYEDHRIHSMDSFYLKQPSLKILQSEDTIQHFKDKGFIGDDTPKSLYSFIINFAGLLHDTTTSHHTPFQYKDLKILEHGLHKSGYKNSAGGDFESYFHYFLVENELNAHELISMSLFGLEKIDNDPVFGSRTGLTCLTVSINGINKGNNSLQLNLDKYCDKQGDHYIIWHDGTLTSGRGSVKRSVVMDYMTIHQSNLVQDGRIYLGKISGNKTLQFDQEDVQSFIYHLITYSLARNQLRDQLKRQKAV